MNRFIKIMSSLRIALLLIKCLRSKRLAMRLETMSCSNLNSPSEKFTECTETLTERTENLTDRTEMDRKTNKIRVFEAVFYVKSY